MSIMTRRKVLVLNKSWSPVAVINLERAMGLITSTYKNDEPKAKILDPTQDFQLFTWDDWADLIPRDGEEVISSVKRSFRIPEIVLLSKYNKLPQQRVHFSRRTIYRRDNNQCQYCGSCPGTPDLSIEHILPRSRGGKTTWENCVIACTDCNRRKADRTPEEAGMKLLKKPTKPKFSFFKGDYRCKSWESILGICYWSVELKNDMD
jgi:5-methylcytosine-specific restriction endonuclease McrA